MSYVVFHCEIFELVYCMTLLKCHCAFLYIERAEVTMFQIYVWLLKFISKL